MSSLILACIGAAFFFILLERFFPATKLPRVPFWWLRITFINLIQILIVFISAHTLEPFLVGLQIATPLSRLSPVAAGFVGYIVTTFIFYWWHRARHEISFLWRIFHQFHHSAQRIETITSFYKHPLEIFVNSIVMGLISYVLLGISPEQTTWVTFFAAIGEYFYHMNVRTPYFLGFFFQRPEMHRVHHQRGHHYNNFADLPLWDLLFGTFYNPKKEIVECGLGNNEHTAFFQMLKFNEVIDEKN